MSLHDAIKEVEKEEKKLLKAEASEGSEDKAVDKEPEALEKQEPEKPLDDDTDLEGAETPPPAEKAPDAAAFAKMRKDAADAKKRADALAEENARLKNQPPVAPQPAAKAAVSDPEPDANTDPEAHLQWKIRKVDEKLQKLDSYVETQEEKKRREAITSSAMEEFVEHEDSFKEATPDYQSVTTFGLQKLSEKVQGQFPNLRGKDLTDKIKERVLTLAAQGQALGFNPAEFLYLTSKNMGYQPPVVEKQEPEAKKPDFKKIVDQKKKSTSSLAAGGKSGKTPLSREAVLDKGFGLKDFARLSPAELKELETL
jgi:hypothetical protein